MTRRGSHLCRYCYCLLFVSCHHLYLVSTFSTTIAVSATNYHLPTTSSCSTTTTRPSSKTRSSFRSAAATTRNMGSDSEHEDKQTEEDDDDVAVYNRFASAAVALSSSHVSREGILTFVRSVRDIDANKRRRYLYSFLLGRGQKAPLALGIPAEVSDNTKIRIPSPSGNRVALIREEEDGDEKKQVLEVWDGQALGKRIVLPSPKLHGKVIADAASFGYPGWDPAEKHIVYTAERKLPETSSFFVRSSSNNVGGKNVLGLGKMESWGEKYGHQSAVLDLFVVDLETGKAGKIENVPGGGSEATTTTEGGYTLGQPVFTPDGSSVVYIGWDAGGGGSSGGGGIPKRLGFIYCQQRPSKLYCSPVGELLSRLSTTKGEAEEEKEDNGFLCLTPRFRIAISPRIGPSSSSTTKISRHRHKLVFLGSEKGFDSHFGNLALHGMDWIQDTEKTETGSFDVESERVYVDHVWNPDYAQKEENVEGIPFPGLYMLQLPTRCFLSWDTLVATTFWASTTQVVRVSLDDDAGGSGSNCKLLRGATSSSSSAAVSQQLLCVDPNNGGGAILLLESSPNQPGTVRRVVLKEENQEAAAEAGDTTTVVTRLAPIASSRYSAVKAIGGGDVSYRVLNLEIPTKDELVDPQTPLQCVLLLPTKIIPRKQQTDNGKEESSSSSRSIPLIVVPHGGPHSVYTTNYAPSWSYLCGCGYAVLQVNFRGSIGFGQAYVETLFGNIGTKDVGDVVAATRYVVDRKEGFAVASGSDDGDGAASCCVDFRDPNLIGICGGSHGGFLAAHCTAQYPDLYRAAVMRNPVTNIASMVTATDIPDWCYVEALGKYDFGAFRGANKDELVAMHEKSPMRLANCVEAPTLVAIGSKDLRVPPSQGMEWYYALRSAGNKCKLLVYDDCDHAIDGVASEADHWINIKRWFDRHLLNK